MRLIDADEVCVQMELSSPISDEQWATITDAELERTNEITFNTPSGRKVVFIKKPTVDAVEVVRCKDCKHRPVMVWSKVYDDFDVLAPEVDGKEDWRCPCLVEDDPYYSWSPNDNWFCGNGERREAE